MLQYFGEGLESRNSRATGGVYNAAMFEGGATTGVPLELPDELQIVGNVDPPKVNLLQLNFEYSDFVPV